MNNQTVLVEISKNVERGDTFDVGQKVKKSGRYICVPCGYTHTFREGSVFVSCFGCLEGKKYNGDDYMRNLGLWEFLEDEL